MKNYVPLLILGLILAARTEAETFSHDYPAPIWPGDARLYGLPHSAVGFVSVKVGRNFYRGSGAVAGDSRLVYSCAHLFYDAGLWATDVRFARAYSDKKRPSRKFLTSVRGYHVLEGYVPGMDFSSDFAVAYSSASLGAALEVSSAADAMSDVISSSVSKTIVGYPAELDYTWEDGFHYMHQTGPFRKVFERLEGPWFEAEQVSTGGGNSGGPVLVEKAANQFKLAGILVSGDDLATRAGIYVLDAAAEGAVAQALDYLQNGSPERSSLSRPFFMRDGSSKLRQASFRFKRIPPQITRVNLALSVSALPGEVDITLRSPSGRTHPVVVASDRRTWSNLRSNGIDVSGSFVPGSDANGKWSLLYRDLVPGVPAFVSGATLTLFTK